MLTAYVHVHFETKTGRLAASYLAPESREHQRSFRSVEHNFRSRHAGAGAHLPRAFAEKLVVSLSRSGDLCCTAKRGVIYEDSDWVRHAEDPPESLSKILLHRAGTPRVSD
jgi:hypothetical protein